MIEIRSPQLGQTMRVRVVTPPGFSRMKGTFPALVINDAQNAFTGGRASNGGWHIDRIAADLFKKNQIRPVVLIGVMPPRRRDWTFAPPPQGGADRYTAFLCETLFPSLNSRFRLSRKSFDTGIIGASFGANIALYSALHRSDFFGKCALMSSAPHMGKPLSAMIKDHKRIPLSRLYIDCGTRWAYDDPFGSGFDNVRFNRGLMREAAARMPKGSFQGHVFAGHFHNEEFWRKRIPGILRFLFGK